jgi:hypothetical protein
MIEILRADGGVRTLGLDPFLDELESSRRRVSTSFAAERLQLVTDLSSSILKRRDKVMAPAVIHFAYWTRKGALKQLAEGALGRLPPDCIGRPRGLVFHLPPQNVETVFLYSWVLAYLTGNANITRLPTTLSEDMAELLGLFQAALAERGDDGQLFVRYSISERINRAISSASDARLVWGGDAKVATFAALPLRDGGKSIWFGDRRSLAVLNGPAISFLDAPARRMLADNLRNDIFTFDQMACSSPQRLLIVGDQARDEAAILALLGDLSDSALDHGADAGTGHAMRKMVLAMARSGVGEARKVVRHSNALTTLMMESVRQTEPVGGGYLEVSYVAKLADIYGHLRENTQTAVHFGFDVEDIKDFARGLPPFCVTRIAPVGQALDFDFIWDGYDLCAELMKLLRVG